MLASSATGSRHKLPYEDTAPMSSFETEASVLEEPVVGRRMAEPARTLVPPPLSSVWEPAPAPALLLPGPARLLAPAPLPPPALLPTLPPPPFAVEAPPPPRTLRAGCGGAGGRTPKSAAPGCVVAVVAAGGHGSCCAGLGCGATPRLELVGPLLAAPPSALVACVGVP